MIYTAKEDVILQSLYSKFIFKKDDVVKEEIAKKFLHYMNINDDPIETQGSHKNERKGK